MAKKTSIDYRAIIDEFVQNNYMVACKSDGLLYLYDESTGVYAPVDSIELSKLVDDFIINSDLEWTDYLMNVVMKYVTTAVEYVEQMGREDRIVFSNGTFDVKKWKLLNHSPKNLAISALPFPYDPKAKCPLFMQTIKEIANGDKKLVKTLLEIGGHCMTHSQINKKLIIMLSPGGSGKSVIMNVYSLVTGEKYVSNLSIPEINAERAFSRVALLNSMLNIVHELNSKETWNSIFGENTKKLISGEDISAEKKFGARVSFAPRVSSIIVASNFCPTFDCIPSESILRRLLILNITKTFKQEEQDPYLLDKLKEELSGIANVFLAFYVKLMQNGFKYSSEEESNAFIQQQILDSYPMFVYVKSRVKPCPGSRVFLESLRKDYEEWAREKDVDVPLNVGAISKELLRAIEDRHIPFTRGKSNGARYIEGISIIND